MQIYNYLNEIAIKKQTHSKIFLRLKTGNIKQNITEIKSST